MTDTTETPELYDGPCEAGCMRFHGGELRHTPGCGHYPESLTKANADRIASLQAEADALRAEVVRHRSERSYIVGHNDGWDNAVDAILEGRDLVAERAALAPGDPA